MGWGVSVKPRPLSTLEKDPVPIVQEAGWAPGPVWTGAEYFAPTGIRSPDRPARSSVAIPTELPGPPLSLSLSLSLYIYIYVELILTQRDGLWRYYGEFYDFYSVSPEYFRCHPYVLSHC
jgi:hypothetical protein